MPNPQSAIRNPQSDATATCLARVAKAHHITAETYHRIVHVLGRQPTVTELGIFGVMWAEHCCYASSKMYLKRLPTRGKRILVPAGRENAGVVDLGSGWAVAFKVESHNHPSAVEPHAGAATGVGGILRDIFTMGARPIALLDSLRFGPLNGNPRTGFLFEGVVKGISDYGNAVGVPTVGGEVLFDATYRENPLVNVMCLGLVRARRLAQGAARGVGNPVVYVGSSTGRDGLGGASFASRELGEDGEADRPAVQIGDPFAEKCLLEATLEALASGDVVGIQDMGAAGLTCSSCEMPARAAAGGPARGGTGMEIDVAKVPRREQGMTPYEIMLSESQERMLLVVKRGRVSAVKRHCSKWGLNAVEIGRVTSTGRLRVRDGREVVADIPVAALTSEAPVYQRPVKRPADLDALQRLTLEEIPELGDYGEALRALLRSPTIASKAQVFEQYDHMVQTNTVALPGEADAALLRIRETGQLLAATTDGNGRMCRLDPYEGGKLAVAEAARNLACVGARPLAVTDCLNFGSPEDPEVMWQFAECVRGIAEACRAFGTPVTGGNVSFYNESAKGAIDPTPVIGMIGLIEAGSWKREAGRRARARRQLRPSPFDLPPVVTASFKEEGDIILLLGETKEELGGSEYLAVIHGKKAGRPPRVDLPQERALQRLLVEATRRGLLASAHDCSEGGLAVALAECCLMDPDHLIGATIDLAHSAQHTAHRDPAAGGRSKVEGRSGLSSSFPLPPSTAGLRTDAWLFGESAGRIVVSCRSNRVEAVKRLARRRGVSAAVLGRVGGSRLVIAPWMDVGMAELNEAWRTGLGATMADVDWRAFNGKIQRELSAGKGVLYDNPRAFLRDLKQRIGQET